MSEIREKVKAAGQRRYVTVDIPQLGKCIFQNMTERDRQKIAWNSYERNKSLDGEALAKSQRKYGEQANARAISLCWVNEKHLREFTDSEEDLAMLMAMDARIIEAMMAAINDHCGFNETVDEESAKNSESIPTDGSPMNSQPVAVG